MVVMRPRRTQFDPHSAPSRPSRVQEVHHTCRHLVACAAVVKVCGGDDEATLGLAASISVMATAATRPNRRTVDSYSTTAWHPVRRAINFQAPT